MQPYLPNMNQTYYIYGMFLNQHPEYRLAPKDKVVSIMLEQRLITKDQADYLNGKLQIPKLEDLAQSTSFNMLQVFDAQFTRVDSKSSVSIIQQPVFHKVFKDLIIKSNGQIDMAQFGLNNIKNRFKSDLYKVTVNIKKPTMICVYDKKTQQLILSITFDEDMPNSVYCFYSTGHGGNRSYRIENGKVVMADTDMGHSVKTTRYNKDGQIDRIYIKSSGNIVKTIIYNNGYPYIESTDDTTKNLLVEDLHADVSAKNKFGMPTTRNSIHKNVLKRINKDNVYTVLFEYKQKYGIDLLEDINNEIGLKKETRDRLINHIKKAMKNSTTSDEDTGSYIAGVLANDIYGLGSGNLEQDVYLINKHNVGIVAKQYLELAVGKNNDAVEQHPSIQIPFTDISITSANIVAPIEGLIESIDMEFGLDEETINKLTKHIIDCAKQSGYITEEKTFYTEDIKQDISSHPEDKEKLEIDLLRLGNRDIVENNTRYIKPNGKLDMSFRQGDIGDCWLIAGIIAIIETPGGKEKLEKLLQYDEKTGDVTVYLKGVDKKYRISAKEMEEFSQLSVGDGDIRAIELAMDKYIKDLAYQYKNEDFDVDIDGNHSSTAFRALLGDGELIGYNELKNKNFNDKHYAYALGSLKINGQITGENENGDTKVILSEKHAYAIIKSDKDYVYVKNPLHNTNFSEEELKSSPEESGLQFENTEPYIIRIARTDLEKMNPAIYIAKIEN